MEGNDNNSNITKFQSALTRWLCTKRGAKILNYNQKPQKVIIFRCHVTLEIVECHFIICFISVHKFKPYAALWFFVSIQKLEKLFYNATIEFFNEVPKDFFCSCFLSWRLTWAFFYKKCSFIFWNNFNRTRILINL